VSILRDEWSYTSTPPVCLHGVDRKSLTLFASCKEWLIFRGPMNAKTHRQKEKNKDYDYQEGWYGRDTWHV
jgi:hypothetical protein